MRGGGFEEVGRNGGEKTVVGEGEKGRARGFVSVMGMRLLGEDG